MIELTCTSCQHLLSIDDAFAGGVCRCQHCGTIQTVPSKAKKSQRTTMPLRAGPAQKELYRHEGRSAGASPATSSKLDELADVITSSGLARQVSRAGKSPRPSARSLLPWLLGATVLLILLVGIVLIIMLKRETGSAAAPSPNAPQVATPAPPPAPASDNIPAPIPSPSGPNFAGLAIDGETIIYLLDNGGSASDILPAIQSACYQSIQSLGSDHRFKIMFWQDGSPMYPDSFATSRSTPAEIAKAQNKLRDVIAQGPSTIDQSLKLAMQTQPDAVVVVTRKAGQLAEDFTDTVLKIRGNSTTKFYAVGIDGDSSVEPDKPGVLANLANKTGGQFLNLSTVDLNRLAR